jgi:hypothetical protein
MQNSKSCHSSKNSNYCFAFYSKILKQPNNKTTKQQNNKTTKQQNNKITAKYHYVMV